MIVFTPFVMILLLMFAVIIMLIVFALRHQAREVAQQEADRAGGILDAENVSFNTVAGGFYRKCARELTYLLYLIGLTLFFLAMEYLFTGYAAKMVWGTLRFLLFAFIPPAVMLLYLHFADIHRFNNTRSVALFHIIPAITVCMVLTNPLHHLFWSSRDLMTSAYVSYVYNYSGPFFWLHAAYSYTVLITSYIVLFVCILKKPRIYRGQGYIMLAGTCASLLINTVYIFEVFVDLGDLTMVAMFVAAVCLYWAIFAYSPVQMVRMARAMVVNELTTPSVIFDNKGILIDANQSAVEAFSLQPGEMFCLTVAAFFDRIGYPDAESLDEKEIHPVNHAEVTYNVIDKMLPDKRGVYIGRYMVFNNITHIRSVVKKLEYSNTHDRFTGMFNRNVFQSELKKIDSPDNLPIALISLNIYGMKFINTVFGYEFGDRVIKQSAAVISRLSEGRGICARLNGDEFVIALCRTNEQEAAAFVREIKETANTAPPRPKAHAQTAGSTDAFDTHISMSSGIAVKESRTENIDLVYKNASNRMFRNKLLDAKVNSAALFDFVKNVLQNNQYESSGHVERISALTQKLAERMHFTPAQQENLRLLSLTHNIGILGTPLEIIKKSGTLSNDEWEEVRLHTVRGHNVAMLFPDLAPIAEDILRHHERYDGLGYPSGLKGEEIPVGAQIMQLVNYYDELLYPTSQESPVSPAEALERVKKQAGQLFSPALAQAFEEVMAEMGTLSAPPVNIPNNDAEMMEILKLLNLDAEE